MRQIVLAALFSLLAWPVLAQLPGGSEIQIGRTPVIGGTASQCLYVTSTNKVGNQACGGVPSGAAGGDLTGTYPNPTIKTSVSLTTPNINVASGTSLALSGATIGANVLATAGSSSFGGDVTITTGVLSLPLGAANSPSLKFPDGTTGLYQRTSGVLDVSIAGNLRMELSNTNFRYSSGVTLGWSAGAASASSDVGISRIGPGVVGIGTGAAAAVDGTIQSAIYIAGTGTAPPAGGGTTFGFKATSTANFGIYFGSGAPTLTAAKGSLYLRSDGTTVNDRIYVATDSAGTWTFLTSGI